MNYVLVKKLQLIDNDGFGGLEVEEKNNIVVGYQVSNMGIYSCAMWDLESFKESHEGELATEEVAYKDYTENNPQLYFCEYNQ